MQPGEKLRSTFRRTWRQSEQGTQSSTTFPAVVVLTGSTGNIGCYLLHVLAHNSRVREIHCLGRSTDAAIRQPGLLADRGLDLLLPNPHIHFHQCDLSTNGLGLQPDVARAIASSATHYVHCAWPVDWNRNFSTFSPAIRGVSGLLQFASSAETKPLVFFVSSIAAAGNWGTVPGAHLNVPEEEVEDWKVARFGYGQSKLVAERLVSRAAQSGMFPAAVCRIGQVSGPVDRGEVGSWPLQEWLPSLLVSSRHLQAIPASLGPLEDVDWVPVDRLAGIIVELLFSKHEPGSTAFHHIVNPTRRSWGALLGPVQAKLPHARIVTLDVWVKMLEESAYDETVIQDNPALKLLSFFQDLVDKATYVPNARSVTLSIKKTKQKSPSLSGLEPISPEWMSLWMKQLMYLEMH